MISSSELSKSSKFKIWIGLQVSPFYLSVCVIFLLFTIGHRYFLRSKKTILVERRRHDKDHLWNILCLISSCMRSMACSLYSSRSSAPSFDFSIDQGESWRVTCSCRGFETRNFPLEAAQARAPSRLWLNLLGLNIHCFLCWCPSHYLNSWCTYHLITV